MKPSNIPYRSFFWSIGTTSFRTAQLNLKIEQQLLLLEQLYQSKNTWNWNEELQTEYYLLMQLNEFVKGEAKLKAKDAREKTSGLVDLGLLTSNREITSIGRKIIYSLNREKNTENIFHLEDESFIYLNQFLKLHFVLNNNVIRPYIILIKLLNEFETLSYDEFAYLLPLCTSEETTQNVIKQIKSIREGKLQFDEAIYNVLSELDNYNLALDTFIKNPVDEDLICLIGINRKSRDYDKPYYPLYLALKNFFIDRSISALELYETINKVNRNREWRNLIFSTSNKKRVENLGIECINEKNPFKGCIDEGGLKKVFFQYLHIFKVKATLEDYFDLNRRYFNLTDTVIFEDNQIKFDILPKYIFKTYAEEFYKLAFVSSDRLEEDDDIYTILGNISINMDKIYTAISKDFNIKIENKNQVINLIDNIRFDRFNDLIESKFNKSILLELLTCFENREDKRIAELVTDEADIPTIFEYILAIIWYEISERKGNLLQYMNLSLDANLLPKTHAGGGFADIVYQYEKTEFYPKHDLLIEATLAEGSNQRRMEIEPVSRHLGEYRLKSKNPNDYAIFATTSLHRNVISDFRLRKSYIYYGQNNDLIEGMKIIPLNTKLIRTLLENNIRYKNLYSHFEKQHQSNLKPLEWYDNLVKETDGIYLGQI